MKKTWLILSIFFVCSLLLALSSGRYAIGCQEAAAILFDACGMSLFVPPPQEMQLVFWNIRLPRILLSFVIGSGMSVAGAVFQALFRNPLAAPETLGATFGASFGAALAIMFFTQFVMGIQGFAFLFGIVAVSCSYFLASRSRDRSAMVLVIAGIVVSAVFEAGLSMLEYLADPYDQLSKIVFWIWGSFQVSSWVKIQATVPCVFAGIALLHIFAWRLNIMTLTEEETLSLGVNVFRWRMFYIFVSNILVAASISAVGSIKWLGLIIPHIARYLVGTDHRKLLPVTAVLGGSFLLFMDTLARSLFASEIPISIVTSVFGAPYLGYLILRKRGGGMDGSGIH